MRPVHRSMRPTDGERAAGDVRTMDIPGLVRSARRQAGLTQRGLAAVAGVSPSTLSRFESGAALPSLPMLERVLTACGRDAQWTLVHRHADLDAALDRLQAQSVHDRLFSVEILTSLFVQRLGKIGVLVGGAWAASIHGLPHEHKHGRLWVAGDDDSVAALAEILRKDIAFLVVDGHPTSPLIRPETLRRHPEAEWVLRLVGPVSTTVVPAGDPWPAEVRVEGPDGPLRVVLPENLTVEDGVRPELLDRWLARRVTPPGR